LVLGELYMRLASTEAAASLKAGCVARRRARREGMPAYWMISALRSASALLQVHIPMYCSAR
jgi:hypothetical protein